MRNKDKLFDTRKVDILSLPPYVVSKEDYDIVCKELCFSRTRIMQQREEINKMSSKTSLNNDFIQECKDKLSDFWIDADYGLNFRQISLGRIKHS